MGKNKHILSSSISNQASPSPAAIRPKPLGVRCWQGRRLPVPPAQLKVLGSRRNSERIFKLLSFAAFQADTCYLVNDLGSPPVLFTYS